MILMIRFQCARFLCRAGQSEQAEALNAKSFSLLSSLYGISLPPLPPPPPPSSTTVGGGTHAADQPNTAHLFLFWRLIVFKAVLLSNQSGSFEAAIKLANDAFDGLEKLEPTPDVNIIKAAAKHIKVKSYMQQGGAKLESAAAELDHAFAIHRDACRCATR